jgi:hypothetical protein
MAACSTVGCPRLILCWSKKPTNVANALLKYPEILLEGTQSLRDSQREIKDFIKMLKDCNGLGSAKDSEGSFARMSSDATPFGLTHVQAIARFRGLMDCFSGKVLTRGRKTVLEVDCCYSVIFI